jgi:hypothetical protein
MLDRRYTFPMKLTTIDRLLHSILFLLFGALSVYGQTMNANPSCPVTPPEETDGYVYLHYGTCAIVVAEDHSQSPEVNYVLTRAVHVMHIEGWIGTSSGSVIEIGNRLTILTPRGQKRRFEIQFDKHQDVTGNKNDHWNLNLYLPAGTVLNINRSSGGCASQVPCEIDFMWWLQDDIAAPSEGSHEMHR